MARYLYRPSHPRASPNGFVSASDLEEDASLDALYAPIVMDRHYENTVATDGTDIGSRRKHREYMRRNNLTTVDDFKETWSQASREREAVRAGQHDRKERREQVERALYERSRR